MNVFQNGLVIRSKNGNLRMHADVHQVYASGDTIEDVETVLDADGRRISEWYRDNQLKCNHSKYQAMCLRSKCKNKTMYINVMDRRVESTSNIN